MYSEINNRIIYKKNLLIYLLLYIGVAQILDFFFPIRVLGLSFFITLVPFALLFFIFCKKLFLFEKSVFYFFIIIFLSLITLCRNILFNEEIIERYSSSRYILFVPIVLMIFDKFKFDKYKKSLAKKFLLITLFIHSVNSCFYLMGLPFVENVDKSAEDYVELSRFAGIMGGANVQAVFTSTVYMILVLSESKITNKYFILLTVLAVLAVIPTVSRGGILIVVIGILYFYFNKIFKDGLKSRIQTMIFLCLLMIWFIYSNASYFSQIYNAFSERFDDSDLSGGRTDRLNYFLYIINDDWLYYFIGIPSKLQSTEFNQISDNVFTLLPSNFGIVFSVFFFIYLYSFFNKKNVKYKLNIYVYLVVLFIISFTNNSILWTAWSYFAIFGFYFILFSNKDNSLK